MRRLPVYILLDTSGSMRGEPIHSVNVGLQSMLSALRQDPYALESVHLSVITFDLEAKVYLPLTPLDQVQIPDLNVPSAGALLFVSQSHNAFLGGLYLFILGLGIGLPLFVASVFGARWLPKPGMWMDRVKVAFGFLMLMLSVYFIRPMLPSTVYFVLLALLCLALGMYLIVNLRQVIQASHKALLLAVIAICFITSGWNIRESIQAYQVQHSETTHLDWTRVTTQAELKQALVRASTQNRPIIIDTYADWCVACQPIEKEVFPRTDVQDALKDFTLIKLDLTHYNESQDLILKQWRILGPPTLLILQADGTEQRALRLTGTFSATQLIKQLQSAQQN